MIYLKKGNKEINKYAKNKNGKISMNVCGWYIVEVL